MSDVWRVLEERLKQKAKGTDIIYYKHMKGELHAHVKWVRLEDVKEAIQQLKQNYVLIKKPIKADILKVEEMLKE